MKNIRKKIRIKTLIGSFILALILWVYVVLSKDYETTIRIPVIIQNMPENTAFSSNMPESIIANLKGQGKNLLILKYFMKSDFKFEIDMSLNENINIIEQKDFSKYIRLPRGFSDIVDFEFIAPDRLNLKTEKKITKRVPINTDNIDLDFEEGYINYVKEIRPNSVLITGPEKIIKDISRISIENITYEGKRRSFSEELNLIIPEAITSDITKTRVFIEVEKNEGQR